MAFKQNKYTEAESLLLEGFNGMKSLESKLLASERRRLSEAGERVVTFYTLTGQLTKAQAWLESTRNNPRRPKLGSKAPGRSQPRATD